MSNQDHQTARVAIPPPILFFACLGAGWLADRLAPVRVLASHVYLRIAFSYVMLAVSFVLGVWSFHVLRAHRTPVDPGQPTRLIVSTGPYRFTRNPLYLALALVLCGLATLLGSVWMYLLTAALVGLLHVAVILPEERYLSARFGPDYLSYRARVRRWI